MHSYSIAGGAGRAVAVPWRAYWRLCKPKVVLLIAFTAVVGMFLSTAGAPPLGAVVFGTLGIALAAASGAALNHVADRHIDAVMARPRRRHARRTVRARSSAPGFLAGPTRRR